MLYFIVYFSSSFCNKAMPWTTSSHKTRTAKCMCLKTTIMCIQVIAFDFQCVMWSKLHEPPTRYLKMRVAHAPRMSGTFSSPPRVSDPDMHRGMRVTHVPWCMPISLTSVFFSGWWWGKRSRHSRRMRNPQFYVSGNRPMWVQVVE